MKGKFFTIALIGGLLSLACVFGFIQQPTGKINSQGDILATRFPPPVGFERVGSNLNSFGEFLRNSPLKPHGTNVRYYDGTEKPNKVAAAVLAYDVGSRDLQQCADAVMRLRAEYLFKNKQFKSLHFNFTNGFNARYEKWREGFRIVVKGNKVSWSPTTKESISYQSFRDYLNMVFTYAGTASLTKELKPVSLTDMQIGDVFIKGGSPGHAVIVIDMAIHPKTKQKLFMVAQSYMPAQDIHVLINKNDPSISPWYKLDTNAAEIITPEWIFESTHLKRF